MLGRRVRASRRSGSGEHGGRVGARRTGPREALLCWASWSPPGGDPFNLCPNMPPLRVTAVLEHPERPCHSHRP